MARGWPLFFCLQFFVAGVLAQDLSRSHTDGTTQVTAFLAAAVVGLVVVWWPYVSWVRWLFIMAAGVASLLRIWTLVYQYLNHEAPHFGIGTLVIGTTHWMLTLVSVIVLTVFTELYWLFQFPPRRGGDVPH